MRQLISVIVRKDQLMWVTLSMLLFMRGYTTVTMLGLHYFKYVFGDQDLYSVFAAILGVTQLVALAILPQASKYLKRRQIEYPAGVLRKKDDVFTVADIYANPAGRDALDKLLMQLGVSSAWIKPFGWVPVKAITV